MSNFSKVKSLKTMEADTDKHTKVQMELRCFANCTDCTALTPELESELAMWLWEMHVAAHHHHHPPAAPLVSSSYTTLIDSVKLPAVPSIVAEDTKSMAEGIRIKSSAEAAIKPETRCSSTKPAAGHEIPAQLQLPKSATKVDKPVTSDMARRANKAAKKAGQRAAKYGPKKLLLAQTTPDK
jgi:hypothetical protein